MRFETLKEAGVTQQEFAALVPCSRVTVNNWVQRKCFPNKDRRRVRSLLLALRLATERGMLPGTLPRPSPKSAEERLALIKRALNEVVASVKQEKIPPSADN